MFRTQTIPAEYLPPADALPEVFYSLPALNSLSPHLNVAERLIDGALGSGDGDRVAYYEGEELITYAELGSRINRMGNGLRALGIGLGDRVVLRLDDGVELVCAILALQLIGAIPVPTYTLLRPGELTYRIDDTQAVGVIVDVNLLPELNEARASCRSLEHIMVSPDPDADSSSLVSWTDLVQGQPETCEAAATGRDDIAMIAYTSGTTGEPKGVISTHADFLANAECFSPDVLNLQPDDIFAGPPALPFSIGTVFLIVYTLRSRCAAVLFPKKSPALILEGIERRRATVMVGVPTFYNLSLQSLNDGTYDLSSLRLCICAGEPMPRALFDQWQKATGLGLHQICGTTEHSGPFFGHRSEPSDRPTTLGIPVPGYHIVVRDPETFEELPRNSEGVLTLMGATGTKYWRKPEQQRKAIRQGWSVVPDIVTMDEDGYVHYVARADDMIVSAGYNIAPAHVEAVISEHPDVLEVTCVGAPDPTGARSEIVKAFLVLRSGRNGSEDLKAELQEFVRSNAAPYMYPREVEFLSELPKTLTGKIRRSELKQRAWENVKPVQNGERSIS